MDGLATGVSVGNVIGHGVYITLISLTMASHLLINDIIRFLLGRE